MLNTYPGEIMDILYLAHRIPFPPDKGDKLRSFRQLEHLAKHYRVWCACFVDKAADEKYVDLLSAYCHQVVAIRLQRAPAALHGLGGLLRGRSITESFYSHRRMTLALNRWAKAARFDVVVAFSSSMARYALHVPTNRRVLDLCDLDSRKWLDYAAASRFPLRGIYAAEGARLAVREHDWLNAFDTTILITEAEAALLGNVVPAGRIQIVGNGVSLPDLTAAKQNDGKSHEAVPYPDNGIRRLNAFNDVALAGPVVGFVGTMDYRPNVDAACWFVENCWAGIRAACPECTFRIVGRAPTRRVQRLGRVPGVEVVGEVTNMPVEVQRFMVSVAPMRIARGLQNKVLEAMAAAKPVVLSKRACEGIYGSHNQEYVVANTPEETTAAVVRLLKNARERERIGRAARRYVAAHHCWEWELQKFELLVVGQLGPVSRSLLPKATSSMSARRPRLAGVLAG
ncbi:MAG: TIGR03087 family PEP-CTERM/XrtA system glycosyltransferase [Phycisphaerae bacterium]